MMSECGTGIHPFALLHQNQADDCQRGKATDNHNNGFECFHVFRWLLFYRSLCDSGETVCL